MFILSFISSGAEFWSVNYITIYEISESKVFKYWVEYLIIDQMIY